MRRHAVKRRRTLPAALFLAAMTMVSVSGGVAPGQAGDPPDVAVSLAFKDSLAADRPLYKLGAPIPAVLYLQNREVGDVYTFRGFGGQPFHLFMTFQGPDGKGITAPLLEGTIQSKTHVPPPKMILVDEGSGPTPLQVEAIETLPGSAPGPAWSLEVAIDDLTSYYSLPLPGEYLVRTEIPMRTYLPPFILDVTNTQYAEIAQEDWEGKRSALVRLQVTADGDQDGYYAPFGYSDVPGEPWLADCDDDNDLINPGATEIPNNNRDDDCNPATPDLPSWGTVLVQADRHRVGLGTHPGSEKIPIEDMPLSVYDKSSGSCAAGYGVSWHHYAEIWLGCFPPDAQGTTDSSGRAAINVAPGEYLLIGLFGGLYVGNSVGTVGAEETVRKYLQVLEKADGKKSAGKSKIVTGSELLIIEPEYVEWTGTQELYPFLFESLDEWGVSTAISPPEGFVADYPSLATQVQGDTQAVQFTVTDVGSEWKNTKVKHKIKHKGKEFVLKTKIGVKKKDKDKDKEK
jgi:hypothetical protein